MDYYQKAKQASQKIGNHPGLVYLKQEAKKAKKILDIGCGEGTRLNTLLPKTTPGVGVDINLQAIKLAKKQYPRHRFLNYPGRKLPFKDHSFDLVYSAFVLEHITNPETFIQEAIRVLKSKGILVILCPNFGAPNRRSPNSTESPLKKLITGFLLDLFPQTGLDWTKVIPKNKYQQTDDDTTVEPYLPSLARFFLQNQLKIIQSSSLWSLEPKTLTLRKLLFLTLGKLGLFPFKYWGPQIFIAASKQ